MQCDYCATLHRNWNSSYVMDGSDKFLTTHDNLKVHKDHGECVLHLKGRIIELETAKEQYQRDIWKLQNDLTQLKETVEKFTFTRRAAVEATLLKQSGQELPDCFPGCNPIGEGHLVGCPRFAAISQAQAVQHEGEVLREPVESTPDTRVATSLPGSRGWTW